MRFILSAAILAATSTFASATPEGYWPSEAQGVSLPKPGWVLVVPAKRQSDGTIIVWDRDIPWMKEWVVPHPTPSGLRTIAIAGDSEDKRLIDGTAIDEMGIDALERLASKYKAPAIAVAVSDEVDAIAVAAWMPGHEASWESVPETASRQAALSTIDHLFSGQTQTPGLATDGGFDIAIVGQRMTSVGIEYKVMLENERSLELISSTQGLAVLDYDVETESPSAIIRVTDGRDVETVLFSAGVKFH